MHEKINQTSAETICEGSYVEIEFDDGEIMKIYLVEERDPEYANEEYEQVSTQSPIGKALTGHSNGEEVTYRTPTGATLSLRIVRISDK